MGWGCQPQPEAPEYPFMSESSHDLCGMRYPPNFYTTASIALRIISPCTFHHYIKVGKATVTLRNMSPSDSAMSAILLPHEENILLSIMM